MTKTGPRVAVITGASSGIGKATAIAFARLGWQVIATGRNPERSAAAEAEIRAAGKDGVPVNMLRGDFELMTDVARVADEIFRLTDRVDILINNAGNMRDHKEITSEGNEITFASNHLAAFLLTMRLMPLLQTAAKDQPSGSVRVLAVSSSGHEYSPAPDWNDLQMKDEKYDAGPAYCFAKLANIMFTRELNRRASSDGIVAQAMHPGVINSNFVSHTTPETQAYMATLDGNPPEHAAQTLIWMATAPETGTGGGRYFHAMSQVPASDLANDDVVAARLWVESEAILARLGF